MFPDTSRNHFFFINLEGDLTIKQTLGREWCLRGINLYVLLLMLSIHHYFPLQSQSVSYNFCHLDIESDWFYVAVPQILWQWWTFILLDTSNLLISSLIAYCECTSQFSVDLRIFQKSSTNAASDHITFWHQLMLAEITVQCSKLFCQNVSWNIKHYFRLRTNKGLITITIKGSKFLLPKLFLVACNDTNFKCTGIHSSADECLITELQHSQFASDLLPF